MSNKEVVEKFYNAFSKLDYAIMNKCYADTIVFSDPVFGILENDEVRDMWEMLCKTAKDFSLTYKNIQELDDEYLTCEWQASYIFSETGKKVVNNVKAYLRLKDGKIIEHSDAFRPSRWLASAFGLKGILLGWTGFMQRRVQKNARQKLEEFSKAKDTIDDNSRHSQGYDISDR